MNTPAVRKTVLWAMAVALAGGLSLSQPAMSTGKPVEPDSPQVMKLLKQARSQAVQLQNETDKLASYRYRGLSRQSHARQLEVTKGHVNDLGRTLDKLEARTFEASAWQLKAIAEIRPVLEQLAERTTKAIEHLNERPQHLRHPAYLGVLTDKSDLAVQLADLLDDHVKYGEAKAEMEELEAKVGPLP